MGERVIAHAYRHALKTYEPRLSYPIELKRPVLEMGCRLSYDADVYYNPDALSIHLEQPVAMPDESAYQERFEKRVAWSKSTFSLSILLRD